MDFKIAGTQNGITGIQLDLKINGISEEIIRATLAQSREARIEILRKMLTRHLAAARRRSRRLGAAAAADADRPGEDRPADRPGRQDDPRASRRSTGASIDVEDDGTVTIASDRRAKAPKAALRPGRGPDRRRSRSAASTTAASPASRTSARSSRSCPARTACATSASWPTTTSASVADVCKVGDAMKVKVIAIDEQDRVKLSRKAAMREHGRRTPKAATATPAESPGDV